MSPPTSLRDRIRLRLRSRSAIETERDDAVANAQGWKRSAERWREEFDQVGAILCERGYHAHEGWGVLASDVRQALDGVRAQHGRDVDAIASALGILTGPGIAIDVTALVEVVRAVRGQARRYENDQMSAVRLDEAIEDARRVLRTAGHTVGDETAIGDDVAHAIGAERDQRDALDHELEQVRAELRATGHPDIDIRGGVSYAVDAAIDRERSRAQDLVERLADVLGWPEHRAVWPFSAPHLVREIAVRLGKPMPRRWPRLSDWDGSRTARALACTCRGERGFGPSSIVDPRCPEHSPGRRFGRSARPLELPPAVSLWVIDPADGWRPLGWRDEVPF